MQLSQRPNLYDYIKVIALISMILDHIGYFLFPEQIIRRVVGRLAFPLFLFLVGYNLSRRRRWSLWIAGIIVQIAIFIAY
ncbi:MAG: TraX family protein [bacterium]|nr:TraX family protein [bacterium]